MNNDSFVGVFNCLNVGDVKMINGNKPDYGGAIVGRLRSHANSKFENNFWLEGSAARAYGENTVEATAVNAEQLASGEVCFKLNGEQTEINWFQTLGEDTYPTLDDSHLQVFFDAEKGYYNDGGINCDLNEDGKVDIADAVTVLDFMASGDYVAAIDLNGDGKIDIADFVIVLDIMVQQ